MSSPSSRPMLSAGLSISLSIGLALAVFASTACVRRALPVPEPGVHHDGSVPGSPDGAVAPNVLEQIARVCTLVAACTPEAPNASACTERVLRAGPDDAIVTQLLACLDATSCDAFAICFGGKLLPNGLPACSTSAHCDGPTLVENGTTAEPRFLSCSVLGLICVARSGNGAAAGACCAASPCTQTACEGTSLHVCESGVTRIADCAAFGGTCANNQCVGTGAGCNSSLSGSCQGTVAINCSAGRVATHDCGKNRFLNECSEGNCTRINANPQCLAGNNTCNGNSLTVCTDSTWIDVSCPNLGFATCKPFGGNDARCVN